MPQPEFIDLSLSQCISLATYSKSEAIFIAPVMPIIDFDAPLQIGLPMLIYYYRELINCLGDYKKRYTKSQVLEIVYEQMKALLPMSDERVKDLFEPSELESVIKLFHGYRIPMQLQMILDGAKYVENLLTKYKYKRGYRDKFYICTNPYNFFWNSDINTAGFFTDGIPPLDTATFTYNIVASMTGEQFVAQRTRFNTRRHTKTPGQLSHITVFEDLLDSLKKWETPLRFFDYKHYGDPKDRVINLIEIRYPCVVNWRHDIISDYAGKFNYSKFADKEMYIVNQIRDNKLIYFDLAIESYSSDSTVSESSKINERYSINEPILTADVNPLPYKFIDPQVLYSIFGKEAIMSRKHPFNLVNDINPTFERNINVPSSGAC